MWSAAIGLSWALVVPDAESGPAFGKIAVRSAVLVARSEPLGDSALKIVVRDAKVVESVGRVDGRRSW